MSTKNGLTITAANSVFMLGITGLFTTAQQLQGYSADAAFAVADVDVAETQLGVDGIMSFGWLPQMYDQTISLQADSSSGFLFETWVAAQNAAKEIYPCFGLITLPGINRLYTLSGGVLKSTKAIPDARKTLAPRDFKITWNTILVAPIP